MRAEHGQHKSAIAQVHLAFHNKHVSGALHFAISLLCYGAVLKSFNASCPACRSCARISSTRICSTASRQTMRVVWVSRLLNAVQRCACNHLNLRRILVMKFLLMFHALLRKKLIGKTLAGREQAAETMPMIPRIMTSCIYVVCFTPLLAVVCDSIEELPSSSESAGRAQ